MLISLVSVPMILNALGKSDYGLYNLIAGVISMLSFLNASMAITTQRYMSVAIGENNNVKLNNIYNTSLVLHFIVGLLIIVLFEICYLFLFDGFLNIAPQRIIAAKIVYQLIVASTFFTIISVPFGALMNAHENMLAFSVISVIDSLLKLLLAFYVGRCAYDRLIIYAAGIAGISLIHILFNQVYVRIKYKEYRISLKKYFSRDYFRQMFGFTGWNTLASVAVVSRNQGIAVFFNLLCGTIANAAYGIANQINGVLGYFSSTFQKALNPQLMKSEGMHDKLRLIRLALISSKYSVWVIALFAIPLIIEMPYVLQLWLKNVPEYTLRLSQLVLILAIVGQYSVGLMSSIQAIGKIRTYQIIMSGLIILNLPICYCVLKFGYPIHYCIAVFIVMEFISMMTRLYMAQKIVGIRSVVFIKKVIVPTISCLLTGTLCICPLHYFMEESLLRVVVVSIVYLIAYVLFAWFFVFDKEVKGMINGFIFKLITKK